MNTIGVGRLKCICYFYTKYSCGMWCPRQGLNLHLIAQTST